MTTATRALRLGLALARFAPRQTRSMSILTGSGPAALQKHREMMEKIRQYEQSLQETSGRVPLEAKHTSNGVPADVTTALWKEDSGLPEAVDKSSAQPVPQAPVEDGTVIMTRILADLAAQGDVHDATMKVIEGSEEWKDYDAHISFELLMLRHRYQNSNIPMTPARRMQMQAHLRQKQRQVMEQHADAVAEEYISSLTPEATEVLRQQLLPIELGAAKFRTVSLNARPASDTSAPVEDGSLQAALLQLSQEVTAISPTKVSPLASTRQQKTGALDPFAGKTLDEITDLFDEREEQFQKGVPFTSAHVRSRGKNKS